jgi:hypothetical protein
MQLCSQVLGEEITKPKVVVTAYIDDLATAFDDVCEQLECGKVLLDDAITPLCPEIKDIAIEDQ